jgi:IS30 family transposase
VPEGYKHLTIEQRCQICALLQRGFSIKDIASDLKVSSSTIGREIKRHSNKDGTYNYKIANSKAVYRKRISASNPAKIKGMLRRIIINLLKYDWSPKQIVGRIRQDLKIKISVTAIYNFITTDRLNGGKLFLWLRHKGKRRRYYNPKKAGRSLIPNRIDISLRDPIVDTKSRLGDWEADTIVGKDHKGGIISLVERFSKFTILIPIKTFAADNVAKLIAQALAKYKTKVLTITFDNGLEFASHHLISEALPGVQIFFAKPYASWQRGLNEHTNGLVRQYLPKGSKLDDIRPSSLTFIQNRLNFRPRSVLNYKAPEEVFFSFYLNSRSIALAS